MSLERIASKAIDLNVKQPFSRIKQAVASEKPSGKGPTLVGEVLKEGALLPFRNAAEIMNWTTRSMMRVLGGTVKLGFQAATLIPLPLPGGLKNAADVRGSIAAYREAITMKASGNPEGLKTLHDRLRALRNDAQSHALAS